MNNTLHTVKQDVNLLSASTDDCRLLWKDYHGSVRLILAAPNDSPGQVHLHRLLDQVFHAMVLAVGLDDLVAQRNIDRTKRELRVKLSEQATAMGAGIAAAATVTTTTVAATTAHAAVAAVFATYTTTYSATATVASTATYAAPAFVVAGTTLSSISVVLLMLLLLFLLLLLLLPLLLILLFLLSLLN